jgi:hypothetical protein
MRSKRALNCCNARIPIALLALFAAPFLHAGENEPRRPFAEWADVPAPGQLIFGTFYEQSEAYHVWEHGNNRMPANTRVDGENYGIDVRQGYFTFNYGLAEKWAADINVGGTTVGWRPFDNGGIQQTTGIMDTTFGVRYQIFNETNAPCPWLPTLTFRAGAVINGIYKEDIAFAPGNHGVAVEPSLLFRKHVGWPGLGVWGDVLYRWEHTTGADQYIVAGGLFQQIGRWELDAGYRHLQTLSGEDIVLGPETSPSTYSSIIYPRDVREISDSIDAGFSYVTKKWGWRFGFHTRKTFDGSNTDSPLWLGGWVDIPLQLRSK